MAAEQAAKVAIDQGMRSADVFVKGPGAGREAAIRALQVAGIEVSSIKDVTPIPHNGSVMTNVMACSNANLSKEGMVSLWETASDACCFHL